MKNLTLGQYFPGHSALHRLDARSKLIAVALLIVALFATRSPFAYTAIAVLVAGATVASGASPGAIARGLRPIILLLAFTALINLFSTPGELLYTLGPLHISREGIATAIILAARLLLLVWSTTLMTMTTTPMALTDGLERLFGPFKRVWVPVHEIALMMSISLRFIPTMFEEADRIMKAQMARGADFESGSLVRRARALIPVLVPLFVASFRRAEDLALAMEARAYSGGEGRTHFREPRWAARDAGAVAIVFLVAVYAVAGRWIAW